MCTSQMTDCSAVAFSGARNQKFLTGEGGREQQSRAHAVVAGLPVGSPGPADTGCCSLLWGEMCENHGGWCCLALLTGPSSPGTGLFPLDGSVFSFSDVSPVGERMLLGASPASLGVGTGSSLQAMRLEIGLVHWKPSCQRRRLSRGAPPPVTTKEGTQTCRSAAHQGAACVPGWVGVRGLLALQMPEEAHSALRHRPPSQKALPGFIVELEFPVD